jgi:hypothetical protein
MWLALGIGKPQQIHLTEVRLVVAKVYCHFERHGRGLCSGDAIGQEFVHHYLPTTDIRSVAASNMRTGLTFNRSFSGLIDGMTKNILGKEFPCQRNYFVIPKSGKLVLHSPLEQCCPTFLCTRAQFTNAYGGAGATKLLLLLLLPYV